MLINPMIASTVTNVSGPPGQSSSSKKHDYGIIMDIKLGFVKVNVVSEVQNKQGSVKYSSKWIPVEHVSEVDPREFSKSTTRH